MASNVRYNMPGPIDITEETTSGLDLLPTNNTLIAMPFKGPNGPRQPEVIPSEYAGSTAEVMKYADPHVKVKLKTGDPEQPEVEDTVRFQGGVEAFSPETLKRKSAMLRGMEAEYNASESLVDRIDNSAKFRSALDDHEGKQAIIGALMEIIQELEDSFPIEGDE